ncbi:hypothetical protein IV203_000312 [Nitzschia inconspicua]|uniref:Uncharacterized protein n=1 Tax=Nitzschia inconspicua TaxID=303405 RepID=A0A9K3L6C0_9STRA|nr:hypothetical protein IV203_000312 [Nitzschia inconspicua]
MAHGFQTAHQGTQVRNGLRDAFTGIGGDLQFSETVGKGTAHKLVGRNHLLNQKQGLTAGSPLGRSYAWPRVSHDGRLKYSKVNFRLGMHGASSDQPFVAGGDFSEGEDALHQLERATSRAEGAPVTEEGIGLRSLKSLRRSDGMKRRVVTSRLA